MNRTAIIIACTLALPVVGLAFVGAPSPLTVQTVSAQAAATEQKATFAIENMICALCPVTVRKAMEGVEGVRSVDVDFEAKTATVVFDPSATSPEAIAAASTNAGYPAADSD